MLQWTSPRRTFQGLRTEGLKGGDWAASPPAAVRLQWPRSVPGATGELVPGLWVPEETDGWTMVFV